MFLCANQFHEDDMEDQRQFFNGVTGLVEVTLEPVIYHDTYPPTENGWTVWDIDWTMAEHFPTYQQARALYEERVAFHSNR